MHTLILVSCATDHYSLSYVPVFVHIDCMPLRTLHIGDERKTVMAAHTGIGVFSGEPSEWEDYVEKLKNYFVAYWPLNKDTEGCASRNAKNIND